MAIKAEILALSSSPSARIAKASDTGELFIVPPNLDGTNAFNAVAFEQLTSVANALTPLNENCPMTIATVAGTPYAYHATTIESQFAGNAVIDGVSIGSAVTSISGYAFSGCAALKDHRTPIRDVNRHGSVFQLHFTAASHTT